MPVSVEDLNSRYGLHGPASLAWFNKSNDLRGACAVIWQSMQTEDSALKQDYGLGADYSFACALSSVFAMNAALSLELIFKAIWIHLNPTKFEKVPHMHDLKELAENANLLDHFSADQISLLEIFTMHIVWIGKYPISKDEKSYCEAMEKLNKRRSKSGSLANYNIPSLQLNWENYIEIWGMVSDQYWKIREASNCSDSGLVG